MENQINYPITQLPGEFLVLNYTRGYRDVQAVYKGEVIVDHLSAQNLKKGVKFDHPVLGKVEMKFAKEKLVVNVIIDGYHSSINKDHPKNRIANVATLFWTLAGFTCLTFLIQTYAASQVRDAQFALTVPLFTALSIGVYSFSAYNLRKGKSAFFWLGLSVFVARIIISVLFVLYIPISVDMLGFGLGLVLRGAFLLGLLFCIPLILRYRKHEPFLKQHESVDDMLIDQKV